MLRKVECDNIFVLAKSEDIANTESHIIMSITESGASRVNKSSLPPRAGGECHKSFKSTGRRLWLQIWLLERRGNCSWNYF